jgi:hypothetical protein
MWKQHMHGFLLSMVYGIIWWVSLYACPDWCEGRCDFFWKLQPLVAVTQYTVPVENRDLAFCPSRKVEAATGTAESPDQGGALVNSWLKWMNEVVNSWLKRWNEVVSCWRKWGKDVAHRMQVAIGLNPHDSEGDTSTAACNSSLLMALEVWLICCMAL